MINLYPLHEKFISIQKMLAEAEGELTPEIELAFHDLKAEKDDKLDALACLIKNAARESDIYQTEISRLIHGKAAATQRKERLEAQVEFLLGKKETFQRGIHKLSFRPSEYIEVIDQTKVPKDYIKVEEVKTVDKIKAKDFLKAPLEENEGPRNISGLELKTRHNLQVK